MRNLGPRCAFFGAVLAACAISMSANAAIEVTDTQILAVESPQIVADSVPVAFDNTGQDDAVVIKLIAFTAIDADTGQPVLVMHIGETTIVTATADAVPPDKVATFFVVDVVNVAVENLTTERRKGTASPWI